jgi:hypothetical protein
MKIIVILIVLTVLILVLRDRKKHANQDLRYFIDTSRLMTDLEIKILEVVQSAGFKANYKLSEHPTKSFSQNKTDLYICTSCVSEDDEKLLYMGLHEVAHSLCPSFGQHSHDEKWSSTFMKLLETAADLGYLDKFRLR